VRLRVNLDCIEEVLNRRRTDGKSIGFLFPPSQTLLSDTVNMKAVLQHAWVSPTLFFLFVPVLFVALSFVITADLSLRLYQQVRLGFIYKLTLLVLTELAHGLPILFLLLIVFNVAIHLPLRWAWNRRANRLNRAASLPKPAVDVAPGIWPPPPNVLEGR